MKKLLCAALLASTLFVFPASAQDSSSATPQKDATQAAAEKADKSKTKNGTDCTRPGGKCNKPKPRKPWFFGKA